MLKADIKHYFDTVDRQILLNILQRKIKDEKVIWLIETILKNKEKGMPLGNLTSQFFANVYLNELDQFVKHSLKAKYYIRYVDDFVILHNDRKQLEKYREEIDKFLVNLKIELHPEKSRIIPLKSGITFLGFRVFYYFKLLKKSNAKRIWKRLEKFRKLYLKGKITREEILLSLEGWLAYASFADTYKLRKKVMARFNEIFGNKS